MWEEETLIEKGKCVVRHVAADCGGASSLLALLLIDTQIFLPRKHYVFSSLLVTNTPLGKYDPLECITWLIFRSSTYRWSAKKMNPDGGKKKLYMSVELENCWSGKYAAEPVNTAAEDLRQPVKVSCWKSLLMMCLGSPSVQRRSQGLCKRWRVNARQSLVFIRAAADHNQDAAGLIPQN